MAASSQANWHTDEVRLLTSRRRGIPLGRVSAGTLDTLYAFPRGRTLRANFVSTVDGGAAGRDGRSGSINTGPDEQIFHRQRALADAILVGAGTALAESYGPARVPLVVVSGRGTLPPTLSSERSGRTILLTSAASGREDRGDTWVLGDTEIDFDAALARLASQGMPHVLCEGGPTLFTSLLSQGLVDELAATTAPRLVAGDGPRMAHGPFVDVPLDLWHLLEEDGTLLALWRVRR